MPQSTHREAPDESGDGRLRRTMSLQHVLFLGGGGQIGSGWLFAMPLGRAAQPAEIAAWVWQLCHGTYMTGETLVVSGGLTVR